VARETTVRDTVVPTTQGNKVICRCGAEMRPWNFIEHPSRRRWILWRCMWDDSHITSMVPEYRR